MVHRNKAFTEYHSAELLEAVGVCRKATIKAMMEAPHGTEIDRACTTLKCALDAMAGTLTGNPEHFWNVQHTTGVNPPRPPVILRTFKSGPWPPLSAHPMHRERKRPQD